jgi:GT2 family glycosyltransferase
VTDRSSGRVVVLHRTVPAGGAPDPRDGQVLRRVLHIAAAARAECVLVAAEPQIGSAAWPELDEAYVRVVRAAGGLAAALADEAGGAGLVIATDLHLGRRAVHAVPDVPVVLDVDALPSHQLAGTTIHVDAAELGGFESCLRRARDADAGTLSCAALVVCADEAVASQVRALQPDTPSIVIPPLVPLERPIGVNLDHRSGALFVGRFASEPGLPDEEALLALIGADIGPVTAASIDAPILRRQVRARLAVAHPPSELATALRRARVVVTARGGGSLAAELAGMAIPHVALDDPEAADRLRLLLADDEMWRVASLAQGGIARTMHDPTRRGCELVDALAAIGAPLADDVMPSPGPRPSGYRPHSRAGTVAATSDAHERVRAEAQPGPIIEWEHALYTNLDLPYDVAYRRWLDVHHDVDARRAIIAARVARQAVRPLVSIVMPVHDTDASVLRAAIESVQAQIYERWQLCIADDGSSRRDTIEVLDQICADDPRIRRVRLDRAGGIAAATNAAIALATGGYVGFLDHDDVLSPDALALVVRLIDADPSLDVVYTDEDKLDEYGRRVAPFAKPDWSPDLLLSCNYVTHFLVVRRAVLAEVGGLRPGFDGAQDYDLLLRLAHRTDRIGHVAAPVYSWRMSERSTAADIHAKPEAHDASRRALAEALERDGIDAAIEPGFDPTWHRVRRHIAVRPTVTVVVPTRDRLDLLAPCIDLVRRTVRHEPLELLIVDNESTDPETMRYLELFDGRVVHYPHRFNYARQMNLAAREASGEVLLLLNNDARPVDDDWFDALLEHALRPEVGAVGARLRFPSGKVQHEGIVVNAAGVALNLDSGPWAVLGENIRDTAAVTGACMMVRTAVWHEVGGMDERLRVAYNDVDLCLRIGERGWRVVYTPYAALHHAESSSRGSLHPEVDEAFYQQRWGPPRSTADPFFTTAVELLEPFSPRL